jgi:phosphatidylserine/phosphatidylglycerophosphate/cardiolipin synthase-like enzyme
VDDGRGIVSVYCPYASGPSAGLYPFRYRPTYVHAKVGIIDDEWLLVGSANLNDRGLITDSEICTLIHDRDLARDTRIDLWTEHLGLDRAQVAAADSVALIDGEWPRRAAENAIIIKRRDAPLLCAVHRYETGRMPGSWLLEEAEALTVEH